MRPARGLDSAKGDDDMGAMKSGRRRYSHLLGMGDENPLDAVANLFDVAMVFAVALIIAMFSALSVPELMSPDQEATIVSNPGGNDMEIIRKKGVHIERYRVINQEMGGNGRSCGTA